MRAILEGQLESIDEYQAKMQSVLIEVSSMEDNVSIHELCNT